MTRQRKSQKANIHRLGDGDLLSFNTGCRAGDQMKARENLLSHDWVEAHADGRGISRQMATRAREDHDQLRGERT